MPQFTAENSIWKRPIPQSLDSVFLRETFDYSSVIIKLNPNTTTLYELKSAGLFSYIDNDEVESEIHRYYTSFEDHLGESENTNIALFRNSWTNILAKRGFTPSEIGVPKHIIGWLKNDDYAIATIRNLIDNAEWRYKSSESLIDQAKKLSLLIRQKVK